MTERGEVRLADVVDRAVGRVASVALERPYSSVLWELRYCWAKGCRVALRLDADLDRVEGHVTTVASSGAFVKVGEVHVPTTVILAVFLPSRLGDTTFVEGERWDGPPRRLRVDPRQTVMEEL